MRTSTTITHEYSIEVNLSKYEDGLYTALCPELGVIGQGVNEVDAILDLKKAIMCQFASCKKHGVPYFLTPTPGEAVDDWNLRRGTCG